MEINTITRKKTKSVTKKIRSNPYILWLLNDDVNSFDHVILCLVKYCNKTMEAANQIAQIVHMKGKCDVKFGQLDELTPIKETLQTEGLTVRVEKNPNSDN